MKNEIVREVFSLPQMDVVKASYKTSVYYIAGSSDISDYVYTIKTTYDVDEATAVKHGLAMYLREHPQQKQLAVPKFDLLILNDNQTDYKYVVGVISDLFRKDDAMELAHDIHDYGNAVVGTYPFELAHTFACMVETYNKQTGNNLQTDIVESSNRSQMDSMELLEKLIRRDHPEDM